MHVEIITIEWPSKYLNLLLVVVEETIAVFQRTKSVSFSIFLQIFRMLSFYANIYAAQYNAETDCTCNRIAIVL